MARKRPMIGGALPTERIREEMILGPSGEEFEAGGISVRAVNLPLFRRAESGSLQQAIRLVVRAEQEAGEVVFSVSDGSKTLDRAEARISAGRNLIYLFVPEVEEARRLELEVKGAAGSGRAEVEVRPQRKWSVYVIHHSHLDIGYTDPQGLVLRNHLKYLDSVLELVRATDGWPEDARFRWNVEVTWPLQYWMKSRPAAERKEFLRRVREGRVEVCALPFSMHTEAYSIDELAYGLRFADGLREEHGLPIVTAMQTDVPGATVGLLNLLVDSGVRYLSVAHNYAGRSVPYLVGGQRLTRPFWWEAANGKRLLVWFTDSPHGSAYMEGNHIGLAEDYETVEEALPGYLAALAERPYPYSEGTFGWKGLPPGVEVTKEPYPHDLLHIRVNGVIADNAAPNVVTAEVVRDWNERWEYPKLRLATNREFFEAAEERLGDRLDTHRGDWTDWWVDGIGSAARPLGFNRRAQADLRAAQTMHAIADSIADDGVSVEGEVDSAYEDMALFDEHTWGAANPWADGLTATESGAIQWAKKASFAREARDASEALVESGARRLSRLFGGRGSALAAATVFNPSGLTRTDLARVFVSESRLDPRRPLAVVDAATGERVPHVVEEQAHARFRPRGSWVSFVARDVPPCGYARYELVEDGAAESGEEEGRPEPAIENEHYRLDLDLPSGCVSSIVDKSGGRELVNGESPFGFNHYVYDRYTSAPHFNHLSGRIEATDLSLLGRRTGAAHGVVTARSSNRVWERVTVRAVGEGVEFVETTYTLLRGVRRLDIVNRIHKIGTPEKESVYFAFPFGVEEPAIEYEVTGGVDSPQAPRVPGSADHMRAIRHWLTLENAGTKVAWATLEAPLIHLGDLRIPYAPFPRTLDPRDAHPATVFSWALNNIWDTNFPPQQGGEMEFRYAVSTGDDVGARELGMRTAAALSSPLIGILNAPEGGSSLPERGSFCSVDHPGVEVVALAPSRRGHGLAVMLQSLASETVETHVSFPLWSVRRALLGSHLEREMREAPVEGGTVRCELPEGSLVRLAVDLQERR
jgi:hypothetical protein